MSGMGIGRRGALAALGALAASEAWAQGDETLWLTFGDSLSDNLLMGLAHAARGTQVRVRGLGRHSTGLSNPVHEEWLVAQAAEAVRRRPAVLWVLFGANDRQGTIDGAGRRVAFGSADWPAAYGARAGALLRRLAPCPQVAWVALPPIRGEQANAATRLMNAAVSAACAAAGRPFLDVHAAMGGEWSAQLEVDGGMRTVRDADGSHFTAEGARLLGRLSIGLARLAGVELSGVA